MKKIVPFQKELTFKDKVLEITSIALDNTLKLNKDLVSGEFIVSGTFKKFLEGQIEEEFKYNIPVDITIDSKYDTSNCNVSIDDFSYEIINESILKVNISVMLDDLDIKMPEKEDIEEAFVLRGEDDNKPDNLVVDANLKIDKEFLEKENNNIDYEKELDLNLEDSKEYSIYRVYTVKEDDTLDIIYEKFNTTKEVLMDYNDISDIKVGSKIIIPSQDEWFKKYFKK